MSFYKPEHEGVQTDDEAIVYAERHVEDGDEDGYGYTHCDWCGDEWPCTTAALLHMNAELRLELSKAEDSLALAMFDVDDLHRIRTGDSTDNRLKVARGNTTYGGRLSSLGAVGAGEMPHARESRSDGRPSWVGKGNW